MQQNGLQPIQVSQWHLSDPLLRAMTSFQLHRINSDVLTVVPTTANKPTTSTQASTTVPFLEKALSEQNLI